MENTGKNNLVCLCVPCYNAEKTISETIVSLQRQRYGNFRLLIVDNASNDRTIEIAREHAAHDRRIEVLANSKNIGAEGNFTRCMQLAEGDFTAIFHSDDLYHPDIVEKEVDFLVRNPDAGAVFTASNVLDENGNVFPERKKLPPEIRTAGKSVLFAFPSLLRAVIRYGNFLVCPSAMVRTEIYKNEIRAWEINDTGTSADLDVWLRIARWHKIGYLTEPLINRRRAEESYSHRILYTRTARADFFTVMDRYLKEHRDFVSGRDMEYYRFLNLLDEIARARNNLLGGERRNARDILMKQCRHFWVFRNARRIADFKLLLIAVSTFIASFLPCGTALYKKVQSTRKNIRG